MYTSTMDQQIINTWNSTISWNDNDDDFGIVTCIKKYNKNSLHNIILHKNVCIKDSAVKGLHSVHNCRERQLY